MTPVGLVSAALVVLTAMAAGGATTRRRSEAVVVRLGAAHPHGGSTRAATSWRRPPARLRAVLDDAALPGGAATAWTAWCTLGLPTVAIAVLLGGVPLGAIAVLGWASGPALVVALRRGAAARAVEAGLPDALEAMARSLRSGAGTRQALREVGASTPGPLGEELRTVTRALDGGIGLEAALVALEGRRPEPGVRLAVAALLLGAEAGGAHARALDGVAASVRSRLAVGREVAALSSQARLSALVIGVAPIAFAVLAAGTDAATATFLLRTPLGLACLVGGLALDAMGALWMHRLAQVGP